jgi:hypothetical protein
MEAVLQRDVSTPSSLHDRDFYAWTLEQAALLKAGKVGALDLKGLAEELEEMSGRERRELQS